MAFHDRAPHARHRTETALRPSIDRVSRASHLDREAPVDGTGRARPAVPVWAAPAWAAPACAAIGLLGWVASSCGGGGGSDQGSGLAPGTLVENAATGRYFVVERSEGGNATSLNLADEPVWGRLVDLVAVDPVTSTERTWMRDLLIGEDIVSDNDFDLGRNPVDGREVLTVKHPFGSAAFDQAFDRLDDGLQRFLDKGLGAGVLPPFTAMPRNAALAIPFNDLLDETTISGATVLVETGYPPSGTYTARVFADPNHGDLAGSKFHSTRVIVDMSLSDAEALQVGGVDPNPLGMPEGTETSQPNMVVRIPTILNAQATQFELLENLSGHPLAFGGNGSTLPSSPTLDVVRAFRSGGRTNITGDPFNGFLRDNDPPQVLGSQGVVVTFIAPLGNEYQVDLTYAVAACAMRPRVGDLVVLPAGVTAEVTQPGSAPTGGGIVQNVQVKLISGSANNFQTPPLAGEYRAPWEASGVSVAPECFVRFSPDPLSSPATGVASDASIVIGFDEPMLPSSLTAFDGFEVRPPLPPPVTQADKFDQNVMAEVTDARDLQEFSFDPLIDLDHTNGSSETYTVTLSPTVTDLAGNPLTEMLPATSFTLNPASPTLHSGSYGFTFSTSVAAISAAVDDNGDGFPEFRGQFIHDVLRGEIRPRPVDRFSGLVDDSRCSVSGMQVAGTPTFTSAGGIVFTPFGVLEPLSPHGSRTMTAWRYFDMGLSLYDESTYNIDVEGLSWAPFTQGLSLDFFSQFEMGLAHSFFLPNTAHVPQLTAFYPDTGLSNVFGSNQLDPSADPIQVVHDRNEGYLVQPLDQFQGSSGTLLAPWPLNQRKPQSEFEYYTYRDTTLTALGGPNTTADPDYLGWSFMATRGIPYLFCPESVDAQFSFAEFDDLTMMNVKKYVEDLLPKWAPVSDTSATYGGSATPGVPSIGLPLLMDFRTFADSSAQGLNVLNWKLATGAPPSPFPMTRLHSTGAQLPNGTIITVNPDQQISASGGYDVAGNPTPGTDDGFYMGQVDFVVRVSQIHSIWLDSGQPSTWSAPVLVPGVDELPSGTSVALAYRGALSLNPNGPASVEARADYYDPYGNVSGAQDSASIGVQFLNGDSSWKSSLTALDGSRYIQLRITMVANVESGVVPYLSALGLSYSN